MLTFFQGKDTLLYVIQHQNPFSEGELDKLNWLLQASVLQEKKLEDATFIGPRKEMVSPWSTNAVEITQTMGIEGITRIEEFKRCVDLYEKIDPMLQAKYQRINQNIFSLDIKAEEVRLIEDIASYNKEEGLALSDEEVQYLDNVSSDLDRKLTDSEVFGFSQVNSEHCRHKIFNGTFVIDGQEMPSSLFALIRKTSKENPNAIVSAYKDNVAYLKGPKITQFAPADQSKADFFTEKVIDSVISVKAETHNFPTTVEPFYGASTGSGGEIRDRMAGGKAGIPLAGTAVYMTSYPRLKAGRKWEEQFPERKWLYQKPLDILIKASNGASDFGNKFGQPLIAGSLLTFEHSTDDRNYGFDKVIMLAGGVGYGVLDQSLKDKPKKGDKIVVMGGDNYRIGMGGSAVSSVDTGEFSGQIELNAVQRANPEMQKRVANAIRALAESAKNPILSIHDHGAGGHLNCLSELVEETGGKIELRKLPVGDPTLSAKEIIGNESQERMGLVIGSEDLPILDAIAKRERAPYYVVGEITADHHFSIVDEDDQQNPVDWPLTSMFGSSPQTLLNDKRDAKEFDTIQYNEEDLQSLIENVLTLESVACKDWLTNKVDRCVSGKVAKQQTTGPLQLPLNNVGVMALDFNGQAGIATAIGHAPVAALVDAKAGSELSVAEALTNIVFAPLKEGLKSVSLSANWMWPAKNDGENARLYDAVEALSEFVIELGINVPTGKDSLSMVQKYPDGKKVFSPGTVIVSAAGEVSDVKKVVETAAKPIEGSKLIYLNMGKGSFDLGGSAFAQSKQQLGTKAPTIKNIDHFKAGFDAVQKMIAENEILAGHDVGSGGLITSILEMCFPTNDLGVELQFDSIRCDDLVQILFSEQAGILLQLSEEESLTILDENQLDYHVIGSFTKNGKVEMHQTGKKHTLSIRELRDKWFESSYLLDIHQSGEKHALDRKNNIFENELTYRFPETFRGTQTSQKHDLSKGLKAAIIREKGVNSDREMAYMLHMVGFQVKDIHMTDLMSGDEDLSDVNFIVFTGGFSNSDVLGSARGWAGAFKYNDNAKRSLEKFYSRKDTLSLGVCNGCQLMIALDLIYPEHSKKVEMTHNDSNKFECSFVNVSIEKSNSVFLTNMENSQLGIWLAHGEGKFLLPENESAYNIPIRYSNTAYPKNPNGSPFNTAALSSKDGRHLAIMPHLERSIFPWNWAHYPADRKDKLSPWVMAIENAFEWVQANKEKK